MEDGQSQARAAPARRTPSTAAQQQRGNDDNNDGERRTFPLRLHEILAEDESQFAMSWNEQGDAFIIHNASSVGVVLERHGMSGEFRSFQRQLNLYGFIGDRRTGISHSSFRRDTSASRLRLISRNSQARRDNVHGDRTRRFNSHGGRARPSAQNRTQPHARDGAADEDSDVVQPRSDEEEQARVLSAYLNFDFMNNIPTSNQPLTQAEIAIYNRRWDSGMLAEGDSDRGASIASTSS